MAELRNSPDIDETSSTLSAALTGWLLTIKVEDLFRTCLSCRHLGDKGAECKRYPGYPIPAHIVLTGCDKHDDINPRRKQVFGRTSTGKQWEDDDIPF